MRLPLGEGTETRNTGAPVRGGTARLFARHSGEEWIPNEIHDPGARSTTASHTQLSMVYARLEPSHCAPRNGSREASDVDRGWQDRSSTVPQQQQAEAQHVPRKRGPIVGSGMCARNCRRCAIQIHAVQLSHWLTWFRSGSVQYSAAPKNAWGKPET